MTNKLVDDLFMTGPDSGATYYSPILEIGSKNGAMVELWVTSATNLDPTDGVTITLEGSNDKQSWADAATTAPTATVVAAPGYASGLMTAGQVIPYSYLRLALVIKASSSNTATAIVSAAVRTYTVA